MRPDRLTLVVAQRMRRARERLHAQIDDAASAAHADIAMMAGLARWDNDRELRRLDAAIAGTIPPCIASSSGSGPSLTSALAARARPATA